VEERRAVALNQQQKEATPHISAAEGSRTTYTSSRKKDQHHESARRNSPKGGPHPKPAYKEEVVLKINKRINSKEAKP
jgi:hypothetical protein